VVCCVFGFVCFGVWFLVFVCVCVWVWVCGGGLCVCVCVCMCAWRGQGVGGASIDTPPIGTTTYTHSTAN